MQRRMTRIAQQASAGPVFAPLPASMGPCCCRPPVQNQFWHYNRAASSPPPQPRRAETAVGAPACAARGRPAGAPQPQPPPPLPAKQWRTTGWISAGASPSCITSAQAASRVDMSRRLGHWLIRSCGLAIVRLLRQSGECYCFGLECPSPPSRQQPIQTVQVVP